MLAHQEGASTRNLYLASAITMLPGFQFGGLLSYISMALPQLMTPNSTGILIDIYQASWLMSVTQPTRVIGTTLTGYLQGRLGRKKCLVLCCLVQMLGCLLIYCSYSYVTLLIALSIAGTTTGMAMLPSYTLLAEMSLIRLRGTFGSLNSLNVSVGILFGMVMSLLVPVHALSLAIMAPSVLFLCLFWILPESPLWLAREGREEESRAVLQWLRGRHYCVEPEFKEMEAVYSEEMTRREEEKESGGSKKLDRTLLLPLGIMCSLFTIQALAGCDTMSYYAITIFSDWDMKASTIAIIYQITITLGYVISPFVMARVDTRPQFMTALLVSAVAQVCMSVSLYLPSCSFLAMPSLVVAGLTYGLGVGPVPFVTMSVIFPQRYKSLGMSVGQITRALVVTLQLKAFPYLVSWVGMSGLFLCHATFLVLGTVFTLFLVPETRNKSLSELEKIFSRKSQESEGKA